MYNILNILYTDSVNGSAASKPLANVFTFIHNVNATEPTQLYEIQKIDTVLRE